MTRPLVVPELVRQRAMSNVAGRRWLDELHAVVAELCARWELQLGGSMSGGTASFVAAAVDGEGRSCVVKVAMPLDQDELDTFERSLIAHRLAGGRGCARLLDHSTSPPAMLLERLGPNLHELGMSVPDVLVTVARTVRAFWRPVPDPSGLMNGADKARWLTTYITASWDLLGRPCARAVVDQALHYCAERGAAFDPATAVLVHGDAHGWNTLAAVDTFKLVDPEGLFSEPAHDLAVPMREYNEPLLAGDTARLTRERAELLAASSAVDPEAVWQWGFIERGVDRVGQPPRVRRPAGRYALPRGRRPLPPGVLSPGRQLCVSARTARAVGVLAQTVPASRRPDAR